MSKVWKVWCEYDIDADLLVFDEKETAEKWTRRALEELGEDFDELREARLVGFLPIQLITMGRLSQGD